jgi:hypothetical protein
MKTKRVDFQYNAEDVLFVGKQLLLRSIERFNKKNSTLYQSLDNSIQEKDINDIKNVIQNIILNCKEYTNELSHSFEFIAHSPELIPSDTEVLKDLPDLKKDSLGIGGRSE